VIAPLRAMWEGRCGNPAKLIVDTRVQVYPSVWAPLSWPVCGDLCCLQAAEHHVKRHGLVHVDTRPLTRAAAAAYAMQLEVAA
jgi:hypothetical protein